MLKTPKAVIRTAAGVAALAATAYAVFVPRDPLQVQLLDVSGYDDRADVWMPFRITLGLSNRGRDPIVIRRLHVEPDFEEFNEAYNVNTHDLTPPLRIEPGSQVSYQVIVTLLNATQLQPGTRRLVLRTRVDTGDGVHVRDFPAEFDQSLDSTGRALRF
jgi:hypothetical protein